MSLLPRRGSNECGIESHVLGAWPAGRAREPRHRERGGGVRAGARRHHRRPARRGGERGHRGHKRRRRKKYFQVG